MSVRSRSHSRCSVQRLQAPIAYAPICPAYYFLLAMGLSAAALAAHDNVLGRDHAWTKDSARVTADALDALGRTEEAKTLRERYGLTGPENLEPLSASK